MRVSGLMAKTLREAPSGAELPSHVFLLRGGYIKQLASGLYSIQPLGKRILRRIEQVIREEMDAIDGQEVELPLVQPSELWEESGRYHAIGAELCRFKDRTEHPMVLAMTHEEAVTDLARHHLSSYKQMPFMVYQFQLKFRDEPRSRGGLVRVREFTMKDAYSFHRDEADLDVYYRKAYAAYERLFARVGIRPVVVQSDTGIMGGKVAHEFMLETEHGEDYLVLAEDGSYSANQEIAAFHRTIKPSSPQPLEKVATPGKKSIEEVSGFLGVTAEDTAKCVFYEFEREGKRQLALVLLRGDLEAGEVKIRNHLKATWLLPAQEDFIRSFGFVPGYASPVGVARKPDWHLLADASLSPEAHYVMGANEEGFHLKHARPGRDFALEATGDFAKAESGYLAPDGKTPLRATRGIEIGNIFKLGTKFSESMGCRFLDEAGKQQPAVMGCYGIGVGRLMAAVVENSHDDFGPIWPEEIAPYQVHLVAIGKEPEVVEACESLVAEWEAAGISVLYDDRDERRGVKFKDADWWGIPIRVAVSRKSLAEGMAEWKPRRDKDFVKRPLAELLGALRAHYSRA